MVCVYLCLFGMRFLQSVTPWGSIWYLALNPIHITLYKWDSKFDLKCNHCYVWGHHWQRDCWVLEMRSMINFGVTVCDNLYLRSCGLALCSCLHWLNNLSLVLFFATPPSSSKSKPIRFVILPPIVYIQTFYFIFPPFCKCNSMFSYIVVQKVVILALLFWHCKCLVLLEFWLCLHNLMSASHANILPVLL